MKTIALVAESGAGKGLFIEVLKKLYPHLRIEVIRFSDILRDILNILGKEKSRYNIDTLVTALREAFRDDGILNHAMAGRLKTCKADIVVLDGLRKIKEIPLVRDCEGILVFITADKRIRYERRRKSPEKPDEMDMSWEQFVEQSNADPQREIRTIGETMADVTLENNGSAQDFERRIKEFVNIHHLGEMS